MPPTPQMISSPLAEATQSHADSLASAHQAQRSQEPQDQLSNMRATSERVADSNEQIQSSSSRDEQPKTEYVSKIGILTTSLPMYHNQIMKAKKEDEERRRAEEEGEPLEPHEVEMLSKMSREVGTHYQTSEQQAESIRRLKPHSRSTLHIQTILRTASQNPEEASQPTAKPKTRQTKWQFGIRSKNEPVDAVKCLYKALETMGDCQWHIPSNRSNQDKAKEGEQGPNPANAAGFLHVSSAEPASSESPEQGHHHGLEDLQISDKEEAAAASEQTSSSHQKAPDSTSHVDEDSDSERDSDIDIDNPPEGYFPKDPWCIHIRWENTGTCPPEPINSDSAQSSHVDLPSTDSSARRNSVVPGTLSSAAGSTTSVGADTETSGTNFDNSACFVYMDLQIYTLEMETYLVDFKCAGYEKIIGSKEVVTRRGKTITEYIGSGVRIADKDVTSPQPFLDLANKLVIHLANKN